MINARPLEGVSNKMVVAVQADGHPYDVKVIYQPDHVFADIVDLQEHIKRVMKDTTLHAEQIVQEIHDDFIEKVQPLAVTVRLENSFPPFALNVSLTTCFKGIGVDDWSHKVQEVLL